MGVVADAQEGKSYKHASENVLAKAGMQMRAAIVQSRCRCAGGKMSLEETREALRRLDEGEEALYPVFFQFLFYDWDLYRTMEKHTKTKGKRSSNKGGNIESHSTLVLKPIYLPSDSSDSSSESEAYIPIRKLDRDRPSPLRIVTVDGINFEMAPTRPTWSHGT